MLTVFLLSEKQAFALWNVQITLDMGAMSPMLQKATGNKPNQRQELQTVGPKGIPPLLPTFGDECH